jgi:hypothetical protein
MFIGISHLPSPGARARIVLHRKMGGDLSAIKGGINRELDLGRRIGGL